MVLSFLRPNKDVCYELSRTINSQNNSPKNCNLSDVEKPKSCLSDYKITDKIYSQDSISTTRLGYDRQTNKKYAIRKIKKNLCTKYDFDLLEQEI